MNLRVISLLVIALCLNAVAQVQKKSPTRSKPNEPDTANYRNSAFGFRYQIPYGWVDRTKEMQDGDGASKGEVLLAIFERPPQAAGDTINAAVVIGAEKAAAFPGLEKVQDYLEPLAASTEAKGFKADGDPTEVEIGSQRLVRADFSKALNDKLTMHQATLVLLSKGAIVSFTFIADSLDAVNDLIDGLSFSSPKPKAK